tara:strand:+ start:1348 stop:1566 length:219 start_codon:yes stop_codon:yes gene_type:complete
MDKKLSTYYKGGDTKGAYCDVHIDLKEEYLYINYFNANGQKFSSESFIGKSKRYVEDAAENWCMGIKTDVPI